MIEAPPNFSHQQHGRADKTRSSGTQNGSEKQPFIYLNHTFDKKHIFAQTSSIRDQIRDTLSLLNSQAISPGANADNLAEQKDTLPENLRALLQDKYEKFEHILHAIDTTLQIDQNQQLDLASVLTNAFSPLADAYGFHIVQGKAPQDTTYAQRVRQHAKEFNERAKATAVPENELSFSLMQQNTQQNEQSQNSLGLYRDTSPVTPDGRLKDNNVVKQFTSVLNRFSYIQETIKSKPSTVNQDNYAEKDTPRKYTPRREVKFSEERNISQQRVIDLLLIMGKSILWEGFNGNEIDLSKFAQYMNEILEAFDLHVDVEDTDETTQSQQNTPQQPASN
jgi:hypothetical protein